MQPQGSAFPGVTPDAMSFLENLDERSARFSQEPEDEFPAAFKERRRVVRRRPNMVQGRSLEKLGHAVEYLVDSRMFLVEPATAKAEREAVRGGCDALGQGCGAVGTPGETEPCNSAGSQWPAAVVG